MRSKRKFILTRLVPLVVILAVVAAACVEEEEATPVVVKETVIVEVTPTPAPTPTPPSLPPPGQAIFTIGVFEDLTTTNIWAILGPDATAWNFYMLLNRYPALYGLSDVRFDFVPIVANGLPPDFTQEGGFWVTVVKLKEGMKWTDGVEITADDVVFTVNTVLELELPGNWASIYDPTVLDHAEAVDSHTVKFFFQEKPGLARWQFGAAQGNFVAKHYWEDKVAEARAAGEGLEEEERLSAIQQALYAFSALDEPTAGELKFVKWEPGAFVDTEKNPDYFFDGARVVEYANGAYLEEKPGVYREELYGIPEGDVLLDFTRGPFVDAVLYSVFGSQDAAVLALKNGDISYTLNPLGLAPGLKEQVVGAPGINTIENPSNGVRYLGFNTRRAPMDIKEFRQAVGTLIDKEFMAQSIFQGTAIPVYSMVPEGNGFWYNSDVPQIGKGLTREERTNQVVSLLKGAGFTWEVEPQWDADNRQMNPKGKGLRMPNGELVPELEVLSPSAGYDPFRSTYAIWVERWLNDVGIPANAKLAGFNVIVDVLFADPERDFDMWILGWGLTIFPDYLRDFFHSERSEVGDLNIGGFSNPTFDAFSDELVTTTDVTRAREVAFDLQQVLADELPYVVLFTTPIVEVFRTEVAWPYTGILDGLQNYFQGINGPVSAAKLE